MEISIHSLLEGAIRATDTVAVVDVFRAFTTAAVALANRAARIAMVNMVEEALALRDAGVGQICMGEVQGRAPNGFDFGNSPFEVSTIDFTGKTIIQRTSAGTQGIVAASRAKRLCTAWLVTAQATVDALLSGSPDQVSLVAMGDNWLMRTDEDVLCAIHLQTAWKADPAMRTPFVASFSQAARSGGFTIRPARICTRRTWTSRSTSIATISRLESISRMGDRSRAWKGRGRAGSAQP